jgi:transcriptional regulator with XRE-family HTH domain
MSYNHPPETIERVRSLRYEDGLTRPQIAELTGVGVSACRLYAPGAYIGKVSNAPVRQAFLDSGMTAAAVAQDIGWLSPQRQRNGVVRMRGDSSRLLRALGLRLENHRWGKKGYRQMLDAEHASMIAEACGVAGWSVLGDEDSVAA